ncbi:hypothetical protein ABT324_13945 [Saccharopolyspora sp. NPDC000359]|uniref:hypothetical protein n=1 Tax=Saccharopolyspora sp. NPDC000359 TaxID=3154251 RepID=UPI0033344851
MEEVLRQADWARFDAERDLVRLRDSLRALEAREGVTGAHRLATEKLRERGALLRHPDVHRADLCDCGGGSAGTFHAWRWWTG